MLFKTKGPWRKLVLLCLTGLLAVALAGCGSTVVAKVNGETITRAELDKRFEMEKARYQQSGIDLKSDEGKKMIPEIEKAALDSLIAEKLVAQDAKKLNITVTDKEIDDQYSRIEKELGGAKELDKFLKDSKMGKKDLKDYFKVELTVQKLFDYVTKDISVSDSESEKFYNENKDQFKIPEQVKTSHILVKTEDEANKIITELKQGGDFAKLAKEKSIDPSAAQNSGDLGYITMEDPYVQEFKEAVFSLKSGQMTEKPVKSDFGYHVIKVFDRKPAAQQTYEEAKEIIKSQLLSDKKLSKFQSYFNDLKAKADIVNNLAKDEQKDKPEEQKPEKK